MRRPSLVRQLLIVVNVALVAVLGFFMVWDYHAQSRTYIRQAKVSLDEEAKVLLRSVQRLQGQGEAVLQDFVNEVCGIMKEPRSRGHHMALRTAGGTVVACPHHRVSLPMLDAMERAASSNRGVAAVEERLVVVGKAERPETLVYVSEYVSAVEDILRSAIIRRISGLLVAGLMLGTVVNVVLHRLLVRPLQSMVPVVHRFGHGELGARMPTINTMELGVLGDEFDRMAGSLQEAEEERHLRMRTAQRIQQKLLPDLSAVEGVCLDCRFLPADEVAGDFYDVLSLPDGAMLLCVSDVSGHGVPAAMVAAMLEALLRNAAEREADPATLLRMVNWALCRLSTDETFATMVLARWDPQSRTLRFVSAGHEQAYLIPHQDKAQGLPSTGPVLGISEAAEWTTMSRAIPDGGRLVIVTDGIVEAASPTGEPFGKGRLQTLLEGSRSEPLAAMLDQLIDRIAEHRAQASQSDDITVLAAEL
ncbi:MAG: PP2C family protein-serine/threonine phosphatase [Planctomycetota bacterium]